MSQPKTKTTTLETTEKFDRIRTQVDDQDYVREYYMNQMDAIKSIAALEVYADLLMDMTIIMFETMKNDMILTPQQQATFQKLKYFHNVLGAIKLQTNTWELDWLYAMIKTESNSLRKEFIAKRNELELGPPLPIPNIATTL